MSKEGSHADYTNGAAGDGVLNVAPASGINASATASNHVLVVGDWRHYVIADRIRTTVELVPHVFGGNQRPTGERGLLMWSRVGADSVADNAFRALNLATTA